MSTTLAYLAGAMDADGHFSIRKSTYHMRKRLDATQPVYSEKVGLKQVTPQVPRLLAETFGGHVGVGAGQTPNSRPLHRYAATDAIAAKVAAALLPFLRIKSRQAELILELRESKEAGYGQLSYWFERENPDWQSLETISTAEAAKMLGFSGTVAITRAIRNGSILALPGRIKRVCRKFVVEYMAHQARGRTKMGRVRPPQLIAWRERLFETVRSLNKVGVDGTSSNSRTGAHAPAA